MKTKIFKALLAIICIFTLSYAASAQQMASYTTQLEEKSLPVGEFSTIHVANDFEITLSRGSYGVKVSTDKILAPYVQVYVRAKTLYISYDEKSVPKDTKKLFKGKNAPKPVFRAIVYLPQLNGLQLYGNASAYATDDFNGASFKLEMSDKAQLKNLSVECLDAGINLKKNAQASLTLKVQNQTDIIIDGNANLKVRCDAASLNAQVNSSSDLLLSGGCNNASLKLAGSSNSEATLNLTEKLKLDATGSAEFKLNGTTLDMELNTDKSCKLDAAKFTAKNLVANMAGGSRIDICVEENLNATLVGGSSLYYTGQPVITIGKILKSTLAPVGSTAK